MKRRKAMPNVVGWKEPKSICQCGHTGDGVKSDHEDWMGMPWSAGHGECTAVGCTCRKFSWKKWTDKFDHELSKSGKTI